MKITLTACLSILLYAITLSAQDINIIPLPKKVEKRGNIPKPNLMIPFKERVPEPDTSFVRSISTNRVEPTKKKLKRKKKKQKQKKLRKPKIEWGFAKVAYGSKQEDSNNPGTEKSNIFNCGKSMSNSLLKPILKQK